ncbi:C3 and PZP-like alpha-2-macroglobulin domain-containing protein 8, partial [Goodea atripinnis]
KEGVCQEISQAHSFYYKGFLIGRVGRGLHPSNTSIILEWAGQFPGQVQHIGFSTGWGSIGEFKIWRKEDSDDDHNEAFTLGVPHNMVPGSERATAFMIGILVYGWRHTQCISKVFTHLKFLCLLFLISCDTK